MITTSPAHLPRPGRAADQHAARCLCILADRCDRVEGMSVTYDDRAEPTVLRVSLGYGLPLVEVRCHSDPDARTGFVYARDVLSLAYGTPADIPGTAATVRALLEGGGLRIASTGPASAKPPRIEITGPEEKETRA